MYLPCTRMYCVYVDPPDSYFYSFAQNISIFLCAPLIAVFLCFQAQAEAYAAGEEARSARTVQSRKG